MTKKMGSSDGVEIIPESYEEVKSIEKLLGDFDERDL